MPPPEGAVAMGRGRGPVGQDSPELWVRRLEGELASMKQVSSRLVRGCCVGLIWGMSWPMRASSDRALCSGRFRVHAAPASLSCARSAQRGGLGRGRRVVASGVAQLVATEDMRRVGNALSRRVSRRITQGALTWRLAEEVTGSKVRGSPWLGMFCRRGMRNMGGLLMSPPSNRRSSCKWDGNSRPPCRRGLARVRRGPQEWLWRLGISTCRKLQHEVPSRWGCFQEALH